MGFLAAMRSARRIGWRLSVSLLDVKLGARMLLKHPLMTAASDRLEGMARSEGAGLPAEQFLSAEITLSDAARPLRPDTPDSAVWAARVAATQQGLVEPQNGLGVHHAAAAGEIYPMRIMPTEAMRIEA